MEVDEKIDTALVLLDNMKQEKKNIKNAIVKKFQNVFKTAQQSN